jgi:ribonuclease P protein subunit RPR2
VEDPSAEYGFLLHDVGKIGIPDNILQKPGPLSPEERALMQTHTVLGEQMLGGVAFLQGAGLEVVRSHHERWDGDGYPDGLGGEDIPLGARVFAVADTLDAMTSDRPYRRALPWASAGAEILRQRGGQFDPAIVRAFQDAEPRLKAVHAELVTA